MFHKDSCKINDSKIKYSSKVFIDFNEIFFKTKINEETNEVIFKHFLTISAFVDSFFYISYIKEYIELK